MLRHALFSGIPQTSCIHLVHRAMEFQVHLLAFVDKVGHSTVTQMKTSVGKLCINHAANISSDSSQIPHISANVFSITCNVHECNGKDNTHSR